MDGLIISLFMGCFSITIYVFVLAAKLLYTILIKTRLVYILLWIIATLLLGEFKNGFFNKIWIFLNTPTGFIVWAILSILICLLSLISLIKSIVQFFIPSFAWSDIPAFFRNKKLEKEYLNDLTKELNEKNMAYQAFSSLEKQEAYFLTVIISTEKDKKAFALDWRAYLHYICEHCCSVNGDELTVNSNAFIDFDTFFDENKLWRRSHYYKEFFEKQKENNTRESDASSSGSGTSGKEAASSSGFATALFEGIKNQEQLKKRYKDLLKIYHSDNQAGDETLTKTITAEYERLLKIYQ